MKKEKVVQSRKRGTGCSGLGVKSLPVVHASVRSAATERGKRIAPAPPEEMAREIGPDRRSGPLPLLARKLQLASLRRETRHCSAELPLGGAAVWFCGRLCPN